MTTPTIQTASTPQTPEHPGFHPRTERSGTRAGVSFDLRGAGFRVGATELLAEIDVCIRPGELVAVIGASGAGKSTLLDLIAGNIVPTTGAALIDGVDAVDLGANARREIGFVPQDDGTGSLPLATTLFAAARLRLPAGTTADDARAAASLTMDRLHLTPFAAVPVDRLSGGQRRRVSIAIELLTNPDGLLLDEPTSGLDPEIGAAIVRELREFVDHGTTVVMTTHHPDDLVLVDRIVVMAPGGRLIYDGTFTDAAREVGSNDPHQVHRALILGRVHGGRIERTGAEGTEPVRTRRGGTPAAAPSRAVQWWVLTWRTLLGIRHQRLTAGIMIGAPAAIIGMFAVLFRPDEFGPGGDPAIASMVAFWVAFAGFFFGLTYGLLQICPDIDEMRRERRAGVPPILQVAAKLTALTPILLAINSATLSVLVMLDRIPWQGWSQMTDLWITLGLDSVASLALGLLVSAAVRTPVQTSLALPMLCFPAVLFAGAMVPVTSMTGAAEAISVVVPVRWAFEDIRQVLTMPGWADPSAASAVSTWAKLGLFVVVFTATTVGVLQRRLAPTRRSESSRRS